MTVTLTKQTAWSPPTLKISMWSFSVSHMIEKWIFFRFFKVLIRQKKKTFEDVSMSSNNLFFHAFIECWVWADWWKAEDVIYLQPPQDFIRLDSCCLTVYESMWGVSGGPPSDKQLYYSWIHRGAVQGGRTAPPLRASGSKSCQASGILWKHEICQHTTLTLPPTLSALLWLDHLSAHAF